MNAQILSFLEYELPREIFDDPSFHPRLDTTNLAFILYIGWKADREFLYYNGTVSDAER